MMTTTTAPPQNTADDDAAEEKRRTIERLADAQVRENRFLNAFGSDIDTAVRKAPPAEKVRFHYSKNKKSKGIYLGTYTDRRGRVWHLRADGVQPRGAMIVGPPGIGKSASYFIPTLLTFEESTFVYDPKGELYAVSAGYLKSLGHKVLRFAPTQDPQHSCHINPFDAIRWGTLHEVADVQNIVRLILDPKDKAAEGAEAHWIVTGSILLECVIIWLHYNDPRNCNLKGCYDYLTDPRWVDLDNEEKKTSAVDEALKHMLLIPHAESGRVEDALLNGWTDTSDRPTPYHPYVVHSAIEIQGKAANEKSGVVSTTTRFLHPFRDPILAELTSYSDVLWDDLMNHEVPVNLYFCIPTSDVQRLRVVVSLFMQLLVRAHTGDNALEYRNGVPCYRFRHRLLLAIDEYPQMGKQEQFILALAVIRSYGLWPMLGVQSPSQIFEALGQRQSLTAMMFYKVFLKPTDPDDAKWISEHIGYTTKREEKLSLTGSRFSWMKQRSVSVDYIRDYLIHYDTLMSMPQSAAIVLAGSVDPDQWDQPIWAGRLFWEDVPEFRRRSGDATKGGQYPAPIASDRIHPKPNYGPPCRPAARPSSAQEPEATTATAAAAPSSPVQAATAAAPVPTAVAVAEKADPTAIPPGMLELVPDDRGTGDETTDAILRAAARAIAGDQDAFLALGDDTPPSAALEGQELDPDDDAYEDYQEDM